MRPRREPLQAPNITDTILSGIGSVIVRECDEAPGGLADRVMSATAGTGNTAVVIELAYGGTFAVRVERIS